MTGRPAGRPPALMARLYETVGLPLEFLSLHPHLPLMRRVIAPIVGKMLMTLVHHDRRGGWATGLLVNRAVRRLRSALKAIHGAICAAKLRRLRTELMMHGDAHEDWAHLDTSEPDSKVGDNRFPRRPLYLGEKWDS